MLVFHAAVLVFSVSRGLWILPAIVSFHAFIGAWDVCVCVCVCVCVSVIV